MKYGRSGLKGSVVFPGPHRLTATTRACARASGSAAPVTSRDLVEGEVITRIPDRYVHALEQRGDEIEALFDGLPFCREDLRDPRRRVSWDGFTRLIERLRRRLGDSAWVELTHDLISRNESFAPIAALAVDPRWLLLAMRLFTEKVYGGCLVALLWDWQPDRQLHTIWEVAAERRASRAILLAGVGAFRAVPVCAGFPAAEVESKLTARRGEYWVRFTEPMPGGLPPELPHRLRERFLETWLNDRTLELMVSAAMPGIEQPERAPANHARRRKTLDAAAEAWNLTPRQADVFYWVARGESNRSIATQLGIAPSTVELHLTAILRKAGVASRTELVTRALKRFSR